MSSKPLVAQWRRSNLSAILCAQFHFNFRDSCSPYHFEFGHLLFFYSLWIFAECSHDLSYDLGQEDTHYLSTTNDLQPSKMSTNTHSFLFLLFKGGFLFPFHCQHCWISIWFSLCVCRVNSIYLYLHLKPLPFPSFFLSTFLSLALSSATWQK